MQRRFAEEDDTICADAMIAEGVTIFDLDDAQRARFVAATRAEVEKTRSRFSAELIELFENDLAQVEA